MSHEATRKTLLFCGIASSLLYAAMIWAIRYEGYNLFSQAPSELTAIGAPTQALWTRLGWLYTVLEVAFGVGLWQSAGRNHAVRIVGGLILAHASLALLWAFAPMHQREVLAAGGKTLSDTMHLILAAVTVFLMFLAIGFGATAFGPRFRWYSIFGHSWGSVLGVLYAARFPEKVTAYVGTGQYGDWAAAASYAFALAEAQRRNNSKALKELGAIGPPPYGASQLLKERTWIQRFDGQLSVKGLWNIGRLVLGSPESSIVDVPNLLRGFRFSQKTLWPEASKLNLLKLAPALQVPVFFFLGRRDHWVPPDTSVAYFEAFVAPSKTLVWFEKSGHEPFVDEPAKFNPAMVEMVRPAAVVPQ